MKPLAAISIFAVLLFFSPLHARAAVSIDNSVGFSSTLTTTLTLSAYALGSGTALVVTCYNGQNSGTISSVTWNGSENLSQWNSVTIPNDNSKKIDIWGAAGLTAGTHNIVITRTGTAGGSLVCSAVSIAGAAQTGQPDATGQSTTCASNTITASATATVAGTAGIAMVANENGGIGAGTGSTMLYETPGTEGMNFRSADLPIPGSGSYSMAATGSCASGFQAIAMVLVAPASGGPVSTFKLWQFFAF